MLMVVLVVTSQFFYSGNACISCSAGFLQGYSQFMNNRKKSIRAEKKDTLFIFDWDDTIFPTTSYQQADGKALLDHGKTVLETLRQANKLGRVLIISNESEENIKQTANLLWPGRYGLFLKMDGFDADFDFPRKFTAMIHKPQNIVEHINSPYTKAKPKQPNFLRNIICKIIWKKRIRDLYLSLPHHTPVSEPITNGYFRFFPSTTMLIVHKHSSFQFGKDRLEN